MKLNESPNFLALLQCTREGDLEKVSSLVENFAVELDCVDKYDYSPLILASLCGHIEIVRYLLQHGASLERDTFDGARCLYGALNDDIRNLLLKYDASTSVDLLQPFAAHLTSLRRDNLALTNFDINLRSTSNRYLAHKFLLAARSRYFRTCLIEDSDAQSTMSLDAISEDFLALILNFIYLDNIEMKLTNVQLQDLFEVAQRLDIEMLPEYYKTSASVNRAERRQLQCRTAQDDLERFVRTDVIGSAWTFESPTNEALEIAKAHLLKNPGLSADALLAVSELGLTKVYPVHKAMLIRSEYYTTVFTSGFAETYKDIPLLTLDTSSDVVELVLLFLYTDRVTIPRSLAIDTLEISTFLLLSKDRSLKSLAAIAITNDDENLPPDADIYSILRIAWLTESQRVEQYAAKYLARNLDRFLPDAQFRELIQESAERIANRQETDTIELVDDIRFYLSQAHGIYLEMNPTEEQKHGVKVKDDPWVPLTMYEIQYNEQLSRLDELLESMSLEA